MLKTSFLRSASPKRLLGSMAKRGLKGMMLHGLRRIGTMMDKALVGPRLLRINPFDFTCNHKCPMCWLQHYDPEKLKQERRSERGEVLRIEDYRTLLKSMPWGLEEVNVVGGGEPLLHSDAVSIMKEIKKINVVGSLISNGTVMGEDISTQMIEMRWDTTRISVSAGDPETYRNVHGVDSFETVRENLKTFTAIREQHGAEDECEMVIFHVIQRDNIPTIEKLFEFSEDVGADSIVFEKVIPYDKGKWLNADELQRARETLESCAQSSAVPCNLSNVVECLRVEEVCARQSKPYRPANRCSVGFDEVFITARGYVMPCCFSNEVVGWLRESSFRDIWHGAKYGNFRKRLINGEFAEYCITNRCSMTHLLHD